MVLRDNHRYLRVSNIGGRTCGWELLTSLPFPGRWPGLVCDAPLGLNSRYKVSLLSSRHHTCRLQDMLTKFPVFTGKSEIIMRQKQAPEVRISENGNIHEFMSS